MAIETPELRFERWRTRGDGALADVFDALAPGLLRLAIHLVGDPAAAEDLVQQTFVTAMERASSWDGRRTLEPWLQGILANHARDLKKSALRAHDAGFDLETALAREEDAPPASASRREVSGELALAVDALEEPYRAAVLLRLRHGLEAADIAHVLGRSPGAVRVQLHRARELLRKSLPAGIASTLVLLAEPARGLECARNQVLEHAARLAPAASVGGGWISGVFAMKKLAVALGMVLIGLAVFLATRRESSVQQDPRAAAASVAELASVSTPEKRAVEVASVAPAFEPRSPIAAVPMPHRMLGRVLYTPGDQPVAGASIELFASVPRTRADFERRWASRSQASHDGWIRPPPNPIPGEVPTLLQLADLEPVRDYSPPDAGAVPISRTTSDEDGRFELPSPSRDGLLVVRAEGFGERRHVWLPRADEDAVRDVYLSRSGRLSARLIDESGEPYEHRVELALRGAVRFVLEPPTVERRAETHFDVWDVETDEQGRFTIDVPAQSVFVQSRDPAVAVHMFGWALPGGKGCAPRGWFSPGSEPGDCVIVVRPTCVLAVSDARTGAPIERIHVRARIQGVISRGSPGWNGWFAAAGGLFRVTPEMDDFTDVAEREAQDGSWSGTVWAPGFAAAQVTVDSVWKAQRVEVRLEPGSLAKLSGRVTRGDAPAAAVPIVLHAGIGSSWSPPVVGIDRRWMPFAGTRTDADGRFEVELFPGRHLATIGEGAEQVSVALDVPASDVHIDLARSTQLRVRVALADGSAATQRPVRAHGPSGLRIDGTTDDRGEFVLTATEPGQYKVSARVKVSQNGGDRWDVEREIDARPGTETVLDLVLPPDEARHGRLVLVGASNPERWTVNVRGWPETRAAIEHDGRIPIDLHTSQSFEFVGPDGFEIVLKVPKDALDGHEFTVNVVTRGYEGVLTSIADGKPLAATRMLAYLAEPKGRGMHAAMTDENGLFRLLGLEDAPYRIVFEPQGGQGSALTDCAIFPNENPADPPRRLDHALPTRRGSGVAGAETIQLLGRLRWAGQTVEGAQAQIASKLSLAGARMLVTQIFNLPVDGRYDVPLPRGDEYSAWFWQPATGAQGRVEWASSGGAVEAHDVDLP